MYETFDHTADLGLRIRSPDLKPLFEEAAEALFSIIVDDLKRIEPVQRFEVELAGTEYDLLVFDWLRELLYQFDVPKMLFSKFEVSLGGEGMRGIAWGEPYDAVRHKLAHEVKAITYHDLLVKQVPDGWLAEVIVDI